MAATYPVVWMLDGETYTGGLELRSGRVTLTGVDRVLSFCAGSVAHAEIERDPSDRIRGLPVLRIVLHEGEELSVASVSGLGSLNEIAEQLGALQEA
jgi:hypothetical protein